MRFALRRYVEADEAATFELWLAVWDAVYPEENYATKRDELRRYLHGPTLSRVWPGLNLPRGVRAAWEARHRKLAR